MLTRIAYSHDFNKIAITMNKSVVRNSRLIPKVCWATKVNNNGAHAPG